MKRDFNIDIETGGHCGAAVNIIACIEDPAAIEKLLTHPNKKAAGAKPARVPESRAPQAVRCDGPLRNPINPKCRARLKRPGFCRPQGWNEPENGS